MVLFAILILSVPQTNLGFLQCELINIQYVVYLYCMVCSVQCSLLSRKCTGAVKGVGTGSSALEGTARYAGPTSSSCEGLRPLAKAFLAFRQKNVVLILGQFCCSVATSVTLSSDLSKFDKNPFFFIPLSILR